MAHYALKLTPQRLHGRKFIPDLTYIQQFVVSNVFLKDRGEQRDFGPANLDDALERAVQRVELG